MVLIGGYDVQFPAGKVPFMPQRAVMSKVFQALQRRENALLESPTGTGKTLALLSSALSWQKKQLADDIDSYYATIAAEEEGQIGLRIDNPAPPLPAIGGCDDDEDDFEEEVEDENEDSKSQCSRSSRCSMKENLPNVTKRPKPIPRGAKRSISTALSSSSNIPKMKKIFFCSRTHSQLQQVVEELRNCSDTYTESMVMCMLGSRQHLCGNKTAREGKKGTLEENCKSLLKTHSCPLADGSYRVKEKLSKQVWDIEDAVAAGKQVHGCSYFGSREMLQDATLVLCPYNFIIDKSVRESLSIDITDSVVIFDEAHNLEDVCRGSASFSLPRSDLDVAYHQLDKLCTTGLPCFVALRDMLLNLLMWFDQSWRGLTPKSIKEGANIWSGIEALGIFEEKLGLIKDTLPIYMEHFKTLQNDEDTLQMFQGEGGHSEEHHGVGSRESKKPKKASGKDKGKGKGKTTGWSQMEIQYDDDDNDLERGEKSRRDGDRRTSAGGRLDETLSKGTRFVLERFLIVAEYMFSAKVLKHGAPTPASFREGGGAETGTVLTNAQDYRVVVEEVRDRKTGKVEPTLHFWCLNAAVSFGEIAPVCHSILLASGTLSPLDSFASELGVPFPVRVEANHVIDVKRQVMVATIATCGGISLEGKFEQQKNLAYQDALGSALITTTNVTPGGVLIFLPSYGMLDRLVKRWNESGVMTSLKMANVPVFVEPREASNLDVMMKEYYRSIDSSSKAVSKRGGGGGGEVDGRAVLIAVCRGKVSEGIDFTDRYARTVMIVGLPYSSTMDMHVKLKKDYQDVCHRSDSSFLNGNLWYGQQAFRAVNQALGRCIRHRGDFGAILLCDPRYAEVRSNNQLSRWARPLSVAYNSFEEIVIPLKVFFSELNSEYKESLITGKPKKSKGDAKPDADARGKASKDIPPNQMSLAAAFANATAQQQQCQPFLGHFQEQVQGQEEEEQRRLLQLRQQEEEEFLLLLSQQPSAPTVPNPHMQQQQQELQDEGMVMEFDCERLTCESGDKCICAEMRHINVQMMFTPLIGRCCIQSAQLAPLPDSLSLIMAAFDSPTPKSDSEPLDASNPREPSTSAVVAINSMEGFLDEESVIAAKSIREVEVDLRWVPEDGVLYRVIIATMPSGHKTVLAARVLASNSRSSQFNEKGWITPCLFRALADGFDPPLSQDLARARGVYGHTDEIVEGKEDSFHTLIDDEDGVGEGKDDEGRAVRSGLGGFIDNFLSYLGSQDKRDRRTTL